MGEGRRRSKNQRSIRTVEGSGKVRKRGVEGGVDGKRKGEG